MYSTGVAGVDCNLDAAEATELSWANFESIRKQELLLTCLFKEVQTRLSAVVLYFVSQLDFLPFILFPR